jgi:hypothetical protein
MINQKTRKSRNQPAEAPLKRIIVTVDLEKASVVKVENLEPSGQHRTLSDEEFATLSGVDDIQDLTAALEDAYTDGITDGLEYAADFRLRGIEPEEFEEALFQSTEPEKAVAGNVRQFLFRRMLRRASTAKATRSNHNGTYRTS